MYATYNGSPNGFVDRKAGASDMEHQIRNWYHYLWLGGDHIVEQACHSVDKINWAMNNEAPLRCWASRDGHPPGSLWRPPAELSPMPECKPLPANASWKPTAAC